ncbi:MAG: hypothetical protein OQK04_15025 [Kangiellaceae bacterium]|nr:hypothetical protein [Kangiellaceae bacterium]
MLDPAPYLLHESSKWRQAIKQKRYPEESSGFIQTLTKAIAVPSLFLAELIASPEAEKELENFRKGATDSRTSIHRNNSKATQQLLNGKYYQELSSFLIAQMAKWYGGQIPSDDALFQQAYTFRPFGGMDALVEISDGIDMADIIGSITYHVRISSKNGNLLFMAVNKMSLESFAGSHYFNHSLVDNPKTGNFISTAQGFEWVQPIPENFLSKN